jgi:hypothetical protein
VGRPHPAIPVPATMITRPRGTSTQLPDRESRLADGVRSADAAGLFGERAAGRGVRGVPQGSVKCVPKWRITLMFAQVRAVPGRVGKSPTTAFPGSKPGPATNNRRSSPVRGPAPSDAGSGAEHRRCRLRGRKNRPAASSKTPGDQPGRENTRSGPPQPRGGEPRRSGSPAKYVPKNSPPRRLPRARHASQDGP